MCQTKALKSQNIYASLFEEWKKKVFIINISHHNNNNKNLYCWRRITFPMCLCSLICVEKEEEKEAIHAREYVENYIFRQFLIDFPVYILWRIKVIHHSILVVWLTHIYTHKTTTPHINGDIINKQSSCHIRRSAAFFPFHENCIFSTHKCIIKQNFVHFLFFWKWNVDILIIIIIIFRTLIRCNDDLNRHGNYLNGFLKIVDIIY